MSQQVRRRAVPAKVAADGGSGSREAHRAPSPVHSKPETQEGKELHSQSASDSDTLTLHVPLPQVSEAVITL